MLEIKSAHKENTMLTEHGILLGAVIVCCAGVVGAGCGGCCAGACADSCIESSRVKSLLGATFSILGGLAGATTGLIVGKGDLETIGAGFLIGTTSALTFWGVGLASASTVSICKKRLNYSSV